MTRPGPDLPGQKAEAVAVVLDALGDVELGPEGHDGIFGLVAAIDLSKALFVASLIVQARRAERETVQGEVIASLAEDGERAAPGLGSDPGE